MRQLYWDSSFRRAFKRQAKRDPSLQDRIFAVLDQLAADPYYPPLRTHALRGALQGLHACWVEYDCRIIFSFTRNPEGGSDDIVLIDIGTHDDVY